MFTTHRSARLSNASIEPTGIFQVASTCNSQLVWELGCSRKRQGPLAAPVHVQSTPSAASGQQRHFQSSSRAVVAAPSHSNVIADAQQPSEGEPKQRGTKEGGAVSKDPNVVGFVPAFILGDIYVCKLPESGGKTSPVHRDTADAEATAPTLGRSRRPAPARLALVMAMGSLGPAAGVVGLFATKAAALLVAHETYQQQKVTARGETDKPVGRMKQAIQDAMSRWRATVTGERPPPWNRFWRRERSTLADLNSDVLSSMRGVEAALLQAEGIMKQLDEAAEELFMRELSVMLLPLAMGLDMVMSRPQNIRLMDFSWKGKDRKTGKGGNSRQDARSVTDEMVPGMLTYTIPGITIRMPSSVGPLQFAPHFTTRHTAEIAWEVLRDALVSQSIQRRKLKRQSQRNDTEMGAARLTGLAARVETQGPNEDEEGLSEPSEVAEFLNELGEGDSRPSKTSSRFKPRGPLDVLGALACGYISFFARAVEWSGNTADGLLVHTPLGQQGVAVVRRPAIQEQPLLTAIARAREWNSALQQANAVTQAFEQRQGGHIESHLGQSSTAASHSGSAASHAQSGGVTDSDAASAFSTDPQTSAQRAQHGVQGQEFKSAKAKHAQQGAAGEAEPSQTDETPAAQHGGDTTPSNQQAADTQASSSDSDATPQQHTALAQAGTPQHTQVPPPHAKPEDQTLHESQSSQQPQEEQQQQQQAGLSIQSMPARLPPMDGLKCVLGNGEELTMLDGLQALITGLTLKMLTSQQDKLQSPFEVPILSLKSASDDGVHVVSADDILSAPGNAKALIQFDMAVASGRKAAVKEDSSTLQPAAKALVLVGDVGFEQYRSASEYRKNKQKPGQGQFGEASVGFGNLSPLVDVAEKQWQEDKQDT